jgi:hypothetical protein
MITVAGIPRILATSATACAWFPDEKASTPRARSAGSSREIALYAPRNLNAPPRWKHSALRNTRVPARASSVREASTGVRFATPASRAAAARTDSSDGAGGVEFSIMTGDRAGPRSRTG